MAEKLATIAEKGDTLATLIALRDVLARAIDNPESAGDIATLTRQFTDVLGRIDALKPPQQSKRDELARKRALRLARVPTDGRPGAADTGGAAGSDELSS